MKVSMDCWTYQRRLRSREWTIWDYLRHCEALRLDGVHLDRNDIHPDPTSAREEYARVREFCEERGWEVIAAGGNRWFASQDTDACLANVRQDLEAAKLLGTRVVRVFPGGDVAERRVALEWSIRNLRKALVLAEEYDCVLALELPHKALHYPADGLELLARVDSEHLAVTFDTGNLYLHVDPHLPPVEAAALMAPHIVATHIRDYDFDPETNQYYCVPCGTGIVDLPAIVEILRSSGYAGSLSVEFLEMRSGDNGEERDNAIAASVDYLRSL